MKLTPVQERFIIHWGEMGSRWGINRTLAQIHALLYLSKEPINAETISDALGLARSGVSTGLKELQGWGIVRVVHQLGDRRDYFTTETDVWELFFTIAEERKRREWDPTLAILQDCQNEAQHEEPYIAERIANMLDFFQTTDRFYRDLTKLPRPALKRLFKMGAKVRKLLPGA